MPPGDTRAPEDVGSHLPRSPFLLKRQVYIVG